MAKDSCIIEVCSFSHEKHIKLVLKKPILIGILFVLNTLKSKKSIILCFLIYKKMILSAISHNFFF